MNLLRILRQRLDYWHPRIRDVDTTRQQLSRFYAERTDYHAMTAHDDKTIQPQIQLFLAQLRPTDLCVEFGCGGGVVLATVAKQTRAVVGFDIAMMGVAKAKARLPSGAKVALTQADVTAAPVTDGCADVAYCLEVVEHVWNPETVITEMIRVLKPGGWLFLTTPNGYSLDKHLKKRALLNLLDHVGAFASWLRSLCRQSIYRNAEPELDCQPAYPDCDRITKIFPRSLARFLESQGCRVERLETYFFQNAKATTAADRERYTRLERHAYYRNFGDHILVLARKRE